MLQVYDRVLASRSVSTLVLLATLAALLYGFQCLLDILRARVMLRNPSLRNNRALGWTIREFR